MGIPIMLSVDDKAVLVAGGGPVGWRKAASLLAEGARVACVSPAFCEAFSGAPPGMQLIAREFREEDLEDRFLVVAATGNPGINARIYELCRRRGILCQTVDRHGPSDFSFMAARTVDGLTLAVSTGGRAPGFAKAVAEELAGSVTPEMRSKLAAYAEERSKRQAMAPKPCQTCEMEEEDGY